MTSDTLEIDDVPWHRIVHFYGRCDEVPAWIRDLASDRSGSAEKMLLQNLEHQDGVIQATPVAVYFVVQALKGGRVHDRAAIENLLRRILTSARFQLENNGDPDVAPTIRNILEPQHRWPEDDEEIIVGAGIGASQEKSLPAVPAPRPSKPWWRFW